MASYEGGLGAAIPSMSGLGWGAGLAGVGLGAYEAFTSNPPVLDVNIPTMGQSPSNIFQYDPSQILPTQTNLLGGIGNLGGYNIGGQFLPQAGPIAQGLLGNYGGPQYFQGAGTAAGLGQGAAFNQYGAGGNILNTAFDPQQALYNRMFAQTTDAARANEMAAGLGTSPIGAYATTAAQNDFNINWQNAQLQRQIQGAQAAAGLQGGAAPLFMQSAGYPWQTGQTIGGANLGTLGQLNQLGQGAAVIPQQQNVGWGQALSGMAGLQQQAYNQQQQQFQDAMNIAQMQMQQKQAAFQEQQSTFGGLGSALGSLGMMAMLA
jgi:hypothetical protein